MPISTLAELRIMRRCTEFRLAVIAGVTLLELWSNRLRENRAFSSFDIDGMTLVQQFDLLEDFLADIVLTNHLLDAYPIEGTDLINGAVDLQVSARAINVVRMTFLQHYVIPATGELLRDIIEPDIEYDLEARGLLRGNTEAEEAAYEAQLDQYGYFYITPTEVETLRAAVDLELVAPDTFYAASLIAYWPFDEGSGTTINDASGHGNAGTLSVYPSFTTGLFSGGIDCPGPHKVASLPTLALGTTHSIAVWLTPDASTDGVVIGGANGFYGLFIDGTDLYYSADVGNYVTVDTGAGGLRNGSWHHLVITRTGTAVRFYMDGAQVGLTKILGGNNALTLDAIGAYSDNSFYYIGLMDELRLYSKALSASDVATMFTFDPDNPPLVRPPIEAYVTMGTNVAFREGPYLEGSVGLTVDTALDTDAEAIGGQTEGTFRSWLGWR